MTLLELESHLAFLRKANYADDNTEVLIAVKPITLKSNDPEDFVYLSPMPPKREGTTIILPVH